VLWPPGSRNGSRKEGKHCDLSTYFTKIARVQFGPCAEVLFPDYGTVLWVPGSRNLSRKSMRFQHLSCQERELSLDHAQRCSFLIIEQSCGPLSVEIIPGKNCDSAPILPRERELSLAHVQRCSFLIMEQCFVPLAVEMVQGKHCDFSTKLATTARAQSDACAEVHFPDYGTEL
jgi:hypothetical protein